MSNGFDEEEDRPTQYQIEDDGKTWILKPPEYLVEDAKDSKKPDDAKAYPSFDEHIVFDKLHADGRIARCYQNVDRYVVKLT